MNQLNLRYAQVNAPLIKSVADLDTLSWRAPGVWPVTTSTGEPAVIVFVDSTSYTKRLRWIMPMSAEIVLNELSRHPHELLMSEVIHRLSVLGCPQCAVLDA